MRLKSAIILVMLALMTGCQGPPPTVMVIVVTTTPNETEVALDLTRDAAVTLVAQGLQSAPEVAALPTVLTATPDDGPGTNTVPPASATATITRTTTPTATAPGPTPLPPSFPTPVIAQIQVAEQLFEGGRMFWIQPTGQLWVLTIEGEGRGSWTIYEDTFVDGEPEIDPDLVPPEGRYQPERGFGKLWRENEALNEVLSWGVTPEFGYVSRYEYHAGGSVDPVTGQYTAGPGYHIVFSLGGELFRFNESDGTWQLGSN